MSRSRSLSHPSGSNASVREPNASARSSVPAWAVVVLAASATGWLATGCSWGDSGPPNPLPVPATVPTTTGDAGPVDPPDAGPPPRTVSWRSPLGEVPENLLVDGDFELSALWPGSQSQSGWRAFGGGGRVDMRFETGGLCRTGLRCAVLERNTALFGEGTSAFESAMRASLWARVPAGRGCDVVDAYVLPCSFAGGERRMEPSAEQPDAQGWCHYEAAVAKKKNASCMYIESSLVSDETVLLDSATLLPEESEPVPVSAPAPRDPELIARYSAIVDWIRRHRIVGRPPEPAQPRSRH